MVDNTLLRLENACFSYGRTRVFSDVSFTVSKGEMLCLLGPNGCGKTTLIDCIFGINPLESGQIWLDNKLLSRQSVREVSRQIAYVPQKHNRHFSFSVLDVLLMGRTPYTAFYSSPGESDIRLAEKTLAAFNMMRLKDRDYTKLSGGETQLVMIMRALVQQTPVIIMDEPTAHLDFRHELIVLETIARLVRERGVTLIMATHFPNHAFYFENKGLPVQLAFMNREKVISAGSPSTALTEENIERIYRVRASVVSHSAPGKETAKQVIPLHTMDD